MSEKRRGSNPVEGATKFALQICSLASILGLGCSLELIHSVEKPTEQSTVFWSVCYIFVYASLFCILEKHTFISHLNQPNQSKSRTITLAKCQNQMTN